MSQSYAATGGDDDDLEELEVQRMTDPDAGDGTVTPTDEELDLALVRRGATTDVVDGDAGRPPFDPGGGPTVSIIIPEVDHRVDADGPMSLDPVTRAMVIADTALYDAHLDTLSPREVDDGQALPAEADLDDGF